MWYRCNVALCDAHARAAKHRHMGHWVCLKCRAQHAAATRSDDTSDAPVYIVGNTRDMPAFEETVAHEQPARRAPEDTARPDDTEPLPRGTPSDPLGTVEIHSDGSYYREVQTGTYAWEIGTHKGGYWRQYAKGGGKCVLADNPHVPLTSITMEALEYLRAQQHLQRAQ